MRRTVIHSKDRHGQWQVLKTITVIMTDIEDDLLQRGWLQRGLLQEMKIITTRIINYKQDVADNKDYYGHNSRVPDQNGVSQA